MSLNEKCIELERESATDRMFPFRNVFLFLLGNVLSQVSSHVALRK